jgi:hypothetical protein
MAYFLTFFEDQVFNNSNAKLKLQDPNFAYSSMPWMVRMDAPH